MTPNPPGTDEILDQLARNGQHQQFLQGLTRYAQRSECTARLFARYSSIFALVTGNWASGECDGLVALAAIARIQPRAKFLVPHAILLLQKSEDLKFARSQDVLALSNVPSADLAVFLLALYRLLDTKDNRFIHYVKLAQIQTLISHPQQHIRYLAIRILCSFMHASDKAQESILDRHVDPADSEIRGDYDGMKIDYRLFSLWEFKRKRELDQLCDQIIPHARSTNGQSPANDQFYEHDPLQKPCAVLGSLCVPLTTLPGTFNSSLILTSTTLKNLESIAEGIMSDSPVLMIGRSGVGKSRLIKETARVLGKEPSMIALHLNEQTDTKTLLGLYQSGSSPGSFAWQPGVVTTAVREGRWLLIENLDRAPLETLSMLLPLLERRQLLVPNLGQTIDAHPEFRIFATLTSWINATGVEIDASNRLFGIRHWRPTRMLMPSDAELGIIVISSFPVLRGLLPQMMLVFSRLFESNPNSHGVRDLLRWSRRLQRLFSHNGIDSPDAPLPPQVEDGIFLEAVDVFANHATDPVTRDALVSIVAEGLQYPPSRSEHILNGRQPLYTESERTLSIGRISLSRHVLSKENKVITGKAFAATDHILRMLESIASAVSQAEPCLLIGETGTGKTTMIQRLAASLGKRMIVINLSKQSEASDLLGGFKPTSLTHQALILKERFAALLQDTLPRQDNQKFLRGIAIAVSKAQWQKTCRLWYEAIRTITPALERRHEPQTKKRKVEVKLMTRWSDFARDVRKFDEQAAGKLKGNLFTFSEGNAVTAVRNGDWLLLDEINLASQETLESLSDLLTEDGGTSPSILLTESGTNNRIVAHPDFRVFGAMNPATDIGKHDLPPSIRGRFTQICVQPPHHQLSDLVAFVRAYLGEHCHGDRSLCTDIAKLYKDIINLVQQNRLFDGALQKPHLGLRNLTRSLMFGISHRNIYGLRRALLEGFCMGFTTSLSLESTAVVSSLMESRILNDRSILKQSIRTPKMVDNFVRFQQYWLAKGAEPIEQQSHYVLTPFIQNNLSNLARAASTRNYPILLQGPTSSGKTSMVHYLASLSGNKLVRINNHEHTDLQEYLGVYVPQSDGRLVYQDGALVDAARKGHWIVLDELNLAPSDVLEALNRLLDDNRELFIPETQEVVTPHSNFILFATQNPAGLYGGRKNLSRAFRNRFLELHFDDIPQTELETILRERSQIAPSFCSKIVDIYRQLALLRQKDRLFEQKDSFATLRDLFRWAMRDADDKAQLARNGFFLLGERVRNLAERAMIKKVVEDSTKIKLDEDELYSFENLRCMDLTFDQPQDMVLTKSMRRLCTLIMHALQRNEPVLLVGETGSGKTAICQALARIAQRQLHIVNGHQNMEAGDLIGSFRPRRDRASTQHALKHGLCEALSVDPHQCSESIGMLWEKYQNKLVLDPTCIDPKLQDEIFKNKERAETIFSWLDGSLISAMRAGAWFLLDEISLVDDSVLERLNSVLEHGRSIFLAEKGSGEATVVGHRDFQFLATMNPGGDFGKKELSPALRNRFTEIWVPPFVDGDELTEIVARKLADQHRPYAQSMVRFAVWFSAEFSSSYQAASLRDLLNWTMFVNQTDLPTSSSKLYHGAEMIFIDGIGANPSAKSVIVSCGPEAAKAKCREKFQEIFGFNVNLDSKIDMSYHDDAVIVGDFRIRARGPVRIPQQYGFEAPTTLRNTMKMFRALQLPRPMLLEGEPGVGKTSLVTAIADILSVPLTRINLSDQTDLMDLFGSDVPTDGETPGQFAWQDAPFLRAMQQGGWVLLDEMNLASQSVLEGLNACLDHRGTVYIAELDRTFSRHPDFMVLAAQNPYSSGNGRKGLPASFIDRFSVVYAEPLTQNDMCFVSNLSFPNADKEGVHKIVSCISSIANSPSIQSTLGGPWEFNLRDVARWCKLDASLRQAIHNGSSHAPRELIVTQRFRKNSDKAAAAQIFDSIFGKEIDPFYPASKSASTLRIGIGELPRQPRPNISADSESTEMDLAITQSILLCIQHAWPVLLTGSASSGKSSIVRRLAALSGNKLREISLTSEMDTSDLIGTYEQVNIGRDIDLYRQSLMTVVHTDLLDSWGRGDVDSALLALHRSLVQMEPLQTWISDLERVAKKGTHFYTEALQEARALQNALGSNIGASFSWVDGFVVQAMKDGDWIVLDNANLCNPSILDRLNSLLETDALLHINEHCTSNGDSTIVRPHPSFRLFILMDPRYGEISSAMRNRCVELASFQQNPRKIAPVLSNELEPRISGLAYFLLPDWDHVEAHLAQRLLGLCFDNLTTKDLALLSSTNGQSLQNFLPSSTFNHFQTIFQRYQKITSICWTDSLNSTNHSRPLYPFEAKDRTCPFSTIWAISGFAFEKLLSVIQLEEERDTCQSLANESSEYKQLVNRCSDRSDLALQRPGFVKPFESFIVDMLSHIRKYLESFFQGIVRGQSASIIRSHESLSTKDGSNPDSEHLSLLKSCDSILSMLQYLSQMLSAGTVSRETLLAFLSVGRRSLETTHHSMTNKIVDHFYHKSESLLSLRDIKSANGFMSLWDLFGYPRLRDSGQYNKRLSIDRLLEKFDSIKWSLQIGLDELSQLQASILDLHRMNDSGIEVTDAIGHFEAALREFEEDPSDYAPPFFLEEFNALYHFTIKPDFSLRALSPESSVYVPRNTLFENVFDLVRCMTGPTSLLLPESQSAAFSASLLVRLDGLSQLPLHSILRKNHELDLLGRHYCQLATESSSTSSLDQLAGDIWSKFDTVRISDPTRSSTPDQNDFDASCSLPYERTKEHSRYKVSMRLLFLLLQQYVTGNLIDPALISRLDHDWHLYRVEGLQLDLAALQHFQSIVAGALLQPRLQHAQAALATLDSPLECESIYRPGDSNLDQLRQEFNFIITHILSRLQSDSTEWPTSRENFKQLIARLSSNYRAYDDITKPLVLILQGLVAALDSFNRGSEQTNYSQAHFLASMVPFINAQDPALVADCGEAWRGQSVRGRYLALRALTLECAVEGRILPRVTKISLDILMSLYRAWKEKLQHDHDILKVKSSLYQYRDSTHDEEQDRQQYEDLFGSGEHGAVVDRIEDSDQACWLAELHAQLVSGQEATSNLLEDFLLESAREIAKISAQEHTRARSFEQAPALWSAVILRLQREKGLGTAQESKSSFYRDANIQEATRARTIIVSVRARFHVLHKQWPEHASIVRVIGICTELLHMQCTEPLARLLTKIEQLHGAIDEWQSVASKEWSASVVYDQVTQLIISWRRLELAHWSQMLDDEDKACEQDAKRWWFLAFETIIVVPLSSSSDLEIHEHMRHTLSTLQEFLSSTCLGQFASRLTMLANFGKLLHQMLQIWTHLKPVYDALQNFIFYFDRLIPKAQEVLLQSRQAASKELKDVCLLASWKDTNITALRESSKRSHHKLLKIIRAYRVRLARPSDFLMTTSLSEITFSAPDLHKPTVLEGDPSAIQFCTVSIPTWTSRPKRFQEPHAVASKIVDILVIPESCLDEKPGSLAQFLENLEHHVKRLRNETPKVQSKETAAAVKSLRTQKRVLFSETLKNLRQAGFRWNLPPQASGNSQSLPIMLASMPYLPDWPMLKKANRSFQEGICSAFLAKGRPGQCHEDISPAEARQCRGYMDSLLIAIGAQRLFLAKHLDYLNETERLHDNLHSLWDKGPVFLQKFPSGGRNPICRWAKWISIMVDSSLGIVRSHGDLSGTSHFQFLQYLQDRAAFFKKTVGALEDMASGHAAGNLDTYSSDKERQLETLLHKEIEMFRQDLRAYHSREPQLRHVIDHFDTWLRKAADPAPEAIKPQLTKDIHEFDALLQGAIDSLLATLQDMASPYSNRAVSSLERNWFVIQEKTSLERIESLRLRAVNNRLNSCLAKMSQLDNGQLDVAAALWTTLLPIISAYLDGARSIISAYLSDHVALCRLAKFLTQTYSQLHESGFCSPSESSNETGSSEAVEEGTGLGDGNGAEDISKDIKPDEDLSELAAQSNAEDQEKMEKEEDAVDMDAEDLQGKNQSDYEEDESHDGSEEEADGQEVDDEIDELKDSKTVDEKLWDDTSDSKEAETDAAPATKGKRMEESAAAGDEDENQNQDGSDEMNDLEEVDEDSCKEEITQQKDMDSMDPYARQEPALDLPEDMDLESNQDSEADSNDEHDLEDLENGSEVAGEPEIEEAIESKENIDSDEAEEAHGPDDSVDATNEEIGDDEHEAGADEHEKDAGDDLDETNEAPENAERELASQIRPEVNDPADKAEQGENGDVRAEGLADQEHMQDHSTSADQGAQEQIGDQGIGEKDVGMGEAQNRNQAKEEAESQQEAPSQHQECFKKLGDAMEEWYKRRKNIQSDTEQIERPSQEQDIQMESDDVQHVPDDEAQTDGQAVGEATKEQAMNFNEIDLDEEVIEDPPAEKRETSGNPVDDELTEGEVNEGRIDALRKEVHASLHMNEIESDHDMEDKSDTEDPYLEIKTYDQNESIQTLDLQDISVESHAQWAAIELKTHTLATTLTEQLRLILAPTTATKMKGDFRTGKRLNMKRIIPYIASDFRRDKIWMRRTIPSKRDYQIMLAIDDSRSMGEHGSNELAFETLALVAKSLGMLEVGQICIVGFGHEVVLAHEFEKPFTTNSGARILNKFTFQQTKTDVRLLLAESLKIFENARARQRRHDSSTWQLQLIISDGICENHAELRRLVQKAQEQQIMLIFIIVDTLHKGESILQMSEAVFEQDKDGKSHLTIKRYLETFPFLYYLVVGQIEELPGILSQALRQWFAEVAACS